jgi:hypothetical protein
VLPGCEHTHGLWPAAAAEAAAVSGSGQEGGPQLQSGGESTGAVTESDEVGRVAGCALALLASLGLSLPVTRDAPGVFLAAANRQRPGPHGQLAAQVAQRLADRGCAATAHRHSARRGGAGPDGFTMASVVVVDRALDLVGLAASSGSGAGVGGGVQGYYSRGGAAAAAAAGGLSCGCVLDRLLVHLPRRRPHSSQLHIPLSAASRTHLLPDRCASSRWH